ncbi:MAG: N-acetylmuramoyl-L-alanine amidase [Bacteroidetes bacterium]|nr:N-acetylmuramoyl-L-alanine amidase [Bacteroidota bacterium]MBU2505134.1 N-acetylmuramoyl-L-alanine amidase [Bacteroidota bacterium]
MKNYANIFVLLIAVAISACSSSTVTNDFGYESVMPYYEVPIEFKDSAKYAEKIEAFKPHLSNKKFFIDPGHGGEDRHNSTRNKQVVEADINLAVAHHLANYLKSCGAEVKFSRSVDSTVSLDERSRLANEYLCDLFISIHHNATGQKNNYWTNFTSSFYHAFETDYGFEPANRIAARYIQRDMAYAMRNSGGLGSWDGTYSDYSIYPGMGFAVLREARTAAVLTEGGFFTNRLEEQRLGIDEFNKIEAWGIFNGIGKYFSNGIPTIELLQDESIYTDGILSLVFELKDESEIDASSITTFIDSLKIEHNYAAEENRIYLSLPDIAKGEHDFRVICANKNGNYSHPYHRKIIIK